MFSTIKIEKKGELHREHRFHGPIKATNINSQILFMKRKKEKKTHITSDCRCSWLHWMQSPWNRRQTQRARS